jgi:threonyl-tRNA synthetase
MNQIVVTLPDGSQRHFDGVVTPSKVAASIGKRLEEAAIAAKVDGKEWDLNRPLEKDSKIAIITKESPEGLEVLRHSTAHLLAHAVKELYPKSQITIGPVIEDGFYYDIDFPEPITPEDLPKIEKKMTEIAGRGLEVTRQEIPREKAVSLFQSMGENYKAELIAGFPANEVVSAYTQGEFTDLCRGPHVPNLKKLGKFKLLSLAGAYWRGNENNKMLTRIYGTAFPTQKELDEHLHRLEEARKRDHRKLGPELGLFTFLPIAPAMPFYLPKGAWLFNALADFMRRETKSLGFEEVICPQLMTADLWKTSGHWEHYRDNMFVMEHKERDTLCLKPMNCPGHAALFATTKRSYRELPLRFSEYSKLHRDERAGVTHGILRTRTFSQDDGHIFCAESQIGEEALKGIAFTFRIYDLFGFNEVDLKLATRPEKFLGTPETWDKAEKALQDSLESFGRPFTIAKGEGAFYGPKIEFHIKDSLKRTWQCGTIQLDFGLPERFQLEFTDSDGKAHRPVMIHRAVLGSIERFFGILVEHHNGHFPFWISPVQATVLNVTSDQESYVKEVAQTLRSWGLRVEEDLRNEKLGYKIREAQMQKVPLMLVLGNKEKDSRTLSVRKNTGETLNDLTLEAFKKEIEPLLLPGGVNH